MGNVGGIQLADKSYTAFSTTFYLFQYFFSNHDGIAAMSWTKAAHPALPHCYTMAGTYGLLIWLSLLLFYGNTLCTGN